MPFLNMLLPITFVNPIHSLADIEIMGRTKLKRAGHTKKTFKRLGNQEVQRKTRNMSFTTRVLYNLQIDYRRQR